ncbi:protein of unknown function [Taphrina deformans PYCC 5710]|uniref:Major facilitator superfamily (MFS) profile domain-containing protein n=1 Tax=Taphrina deformans (strain PYCC 5710 / ATCC 11124 / CBS 356.35 / IMI 108563 / JCM 9778 / NBRC 8474) TaxID=1097556 RepID=R4XJ96_TAPDE|nr:protein of unknown function [Taphrina deformans PYCC 5710]|eukprot:CCG84544.1 protein of unknown function [Taphrina deformans PYCC 5710]
MLFSAIWIAGASVQYIAGNIAIYTVGKILCSLCQGGYLTIAPSYVSEVAPTKNRGAFLAATNFFIVRATDRYAPGPKSYQILFAVQWGFAAIILTGAFFLPESADWCLGHLESSNDYDETELRSSLFRLHGMSGTRADEEVRRLRISFAMDRQAEKVSGNMGYLDCFQGTNFRRTIISLTPPLIQVLCGAGFVLGYQSYFLQITGVAATRSYTITLINYGIFLLGSFLGLLAIERVGRRRMFLAGCYALCISSLLIGIVGESKSMGAKWIFLILISWWGLVYQATLGPIGWAIASESSSRRVRSKTLSMVTMVNAFGNLVFSFINPALINPDKGNLGTKAGFVYGGIMVACSLFSYFWIPEMRGRSYDELDEMFGAKIKARKFSQFMTPHRDQERSCTVK